jgi:hypothetical protein
MLSPARAFSLSLTRKHVQARNKGIDVSQHGHINDVISEVDVVYVTRTQKERFADPAAAEAAKGSYVITAQVCVCVSVSVSVSLCVCVCVRACVRACADSDQGQAQHDPDAHARTHTHTNAHTFLRP